VTTESAVAVIAALTALITALAALFAQIRQLRKAVDGRLAELVAATYAVGEKEGELLGRDWPHRHPRGGQAEDPHTAE
jgi:hypothetical protein